MFSDIVWILLGPGGRFFGRCRGPVGPKQKWKTPLRDRCAGVGHKFAVLQLFRSSSQRRPSYFYMVVLQLPPSLLPPLHRSNAGRVLQPGVRPLRVRTAERRGGQADAAPVG